MICHCYQAGFCKDGNDCQYLHPTVRCHTFNLKGWCPYGYNCRYWHDPLKKRDKPLKKNVCNFFLNNQCTYGVKCTYSHDMNEEASKGLTLSEYRLKNQNNQKSSYLMVDRHKSLSFSNSSLLSISSNKGNNAQNHVNYKGRKHFTKPKQSIKLDNYTDDQLKSLNEMEIGYLKKYFSNDKLREVDVNENESVFCLNFASTDPDWVCINIIIFSNVIYIRDKCKIIF